MMMMNKYNLGTIYINIRCSINIYIYVCMEIDVTRKLARN